MSLPGIVPEVILGVPAVALLGILFRYMESRLKARRQRKKLAQELGDKQQLGWLETVVGTR